MGSSSSSSSGSSSSSRSSSSTTTTTTTISISVSINITLTINVVVIIIMNIIVIITESSSGAGLRCKGSQKRASEGGMIRSETLIYLLKLFELVLLLRLGMRLPVKQLEVTASQSTVPSLPS